MEIKDEERMATIPLISHELAMARTEREHKLAMEKLEKVITKLVIVIVLLLAIIGFGVYEFTFYDISDVVVDNQDGGSANYIGANGVINNAEDSSKKASKEKQN